MATVGRPRTTTRQGARAPTRELGVPDLGLGGWGVVGPVNPLQGVGGGPWRMYVDEWEYVPELRWPLNVRLYDQMRTDSQLAGLLTAVMWGICQLRFVVDPNGAPDKMVKEISDDLNLPILGKDTGPIGRMKDRFTHSKFIRQAMLAAIYGHTFFEQVGEIVDGKWRLRKLAPRMPQTIQMINISDNGDLVSVVQWSPVRAWDQQQQPGSNLLGPEIPVDNLVPFVFEQEGMSWTGRSMMRDCYRDWILKDRNLRIEAINHERAGGVPYAEGAQGMTDDELGDLNTLMQQFRIGEMSGMAVPFGSKVNIAKGTGSDVDKTVKRLDESMARRFLLQLANLAQGGAHVGSYALGETFEDFFLVGQRQIAQWYCDTVTEQVIEDIVDWNYGEDTELTPRLTWERASEDALGTDELSTLVHDGVITMDDETENWVRYRKLMPKKTIPRPEITPAGPYQAPINKTNPQEQASEQPGTGNSATVPANPASTQPNTRASAGSDDRVLPPSEDPAPVRASLMDRILRRKPDVMAAAGDGPSVVTVPNVEILHTGVEYLLSTGPKTFTPEDLRDAVMAANEDPSIPSPRLKLGHIDPRFNDKEYDATPSFGIAKNLRLSDNGMAVYADYMGVPKWLAPILPYAYPSRSIEGCTNIPSQHGKKWRFVLTACALLGVQWPGITVLEDLPAYYGETIPNDVVIDDEIVEAVLAAAKSTGGGPMKWPFGRTAASANLDDIRRAFYGELVPSLGEDGKWLWIQAVYTDPNELVVEDDETGQLFKLQYTSDDRGAVSFGDPQRVRIDYLPDDNPEVLKVAAEHVAATLAVGRTVLASWSDREASVLPTTASGGAMDPKEIRQRLGLSEDASDDQVREALRALNSAVGEEPQPAGEPQPGEPAAPAPGEEQTPGAPAAPTPPEPQPGEEPAAPEQRQPIAASLPPGVVAIDQATLEELRASGTAARQLVERHNNQEREELVAAAIGDGRIPPARRDHWLNYLANDPEGGSQLLASLAPGLVPVHERGHGRNAEPGDQLAVEQDTVSEWTRQLFPETRGVAAAAGDVATHSRISADRAYRRGGVA